ncbi:type 4a pilus biogenesis protein PilO [Vibrio sp. Of7-15]|uniref:type 4a pilus biogenesis protein PilO n=1 Tax=Vibrio sp. Of7-15 TaxID=2724879 RepID=UPI001EF2A2D5|nr:type 4a pilus biogenesis protein PilO [Vibrio sp. Of7-15]MCG7496919.1 type 4a pilus biogenesis protein PilO [Vibrio sp. Of7-15]
MADWRDLDVDEITEWPLIPQICVVVLMAVIIQGFGVWQWLMPLEDELAYLKQQETSLKSTVRFKSNQVAALPQLQAQLDELNVRYQLLIEQLPVQKELASLLSSINQVGMENQLTFTRIDWGAKEHQQFLYRLPLNIELTGKYHNIGDFSEAVARLPRIVNLKNIELQRVSHESSTLHFRVLAHTYQFNAKESYVP